MNNGIFVQDIYSKVGSDDNLPRNIVGIPEPLALPYHYPNSDWSLNKQQQVIFVYDTRNGSNTTITVPISGGSAYNVIINWGNGDIRSYAGTLPITYTYSTHGIYTVSITGSLSTLANGSGFVNPNANKLIKCLSFGDHLGVLTNLSYLFSNSGNTGYPNLIEVPSVIPAGANNFLNILAGCFSFNDPNISQWNVSNVTNMSSAFNGAVSFNQPLDNWNVSNVTNMAFMFQSAPYNHPLNNWNTANVTNMQAMFNFARNFNQNLNNWDVRKVTNFTSMFQNCTGFNGDLSGWQLIASATCSAMFHSAIIFTGIGLETWNTSGVNNTSSMFFNCSQFNGNIGSWNTSNITNMSSMFHNCQFNRNIGSWDTSKVTSMVSMFQNNIAFNNEGSSSINNWNTANVTNMQAMFWVARGFNQPIGNWNVSKVTNFTNCFLQAVAFDQDISNWNLAGIISAGGLDNFMGLKPYAGGVPLSKTNYDALLIGWNNNKLIGANGVANWRTDLRPDFGGAKYTAGGAAAAARAALVSYGWTITDGGTA